VSEHTKEPWTVEMVVSENYFDICCGYQIPGRESPILIASTYGDEDRPNDVAQGKANARRIVACVNACAGISTGRLERMVISGDVPVPGFIKAAKEYGDDS
jgi:hypothetical protein